MPDRLASCVGWARAPVLKCVMVVLCGTRTAPEQQQDVARSSSSSSSSSCSQQGVSCHEDPLNTAATQPACGNELAAAAQQQQQHCARLAAAAQLFSGAAAVADSCSSASLSSSANVLWWWWYLEPGDPAVVRGPYGAGMMIRWLVKECLDDALRIAGVACPPSRKPLPPASHASFQPLGQLLAQVQQGRGYVPCQPGGPGTAAAAVQKKRDRPQQVHALPVSTHSSCGGALTAQQPGSLGQLHSAVSAAAAAAGGSNPGAELSQGPGGGVLEEAMRWWVNMAAASAQLPGPTSVVDILDRVVSSLTAAATPVLPAVQHAPQAGKPQALASGRRV